jgi:hypothetical protein
MPMHPILRDVRSVILATAALVVLVTFVAAAQAQTSDSARVPQQQTPSQPSPQGNTGELQTGSGGSPAASPQGETPPRMQADPQK